MTYEPYSQARLRLRGYDLFSELSAVDLMEHGITLSPVERTINACITFSV